MDAVPFAATKIQPPRWRHARLARPQLEAELAQAVANARVVLLQAPAGFGKTSLLAAHFAQTPAGSALAWVTLDEDDDPARLFACLIAALEPLDLPWRTAPEVLPALAADEGTGVRRAVSELVNALAAAELAQGVIVLDDLHRVDDGGVFTLLDRLIEQLPPSWTLVLASRVAPRLPLNRLHVAGELVVLGQDRLRFDAQEAQALAAREGAGAQADALFERTQGWPAGLRLCLAALRSRPGGAGALAGGATMDRHLFDFLASEVLDDMPLALHDFLLRCSVLPELTAARAAAVSGDARAIERLDEIERRGLFATALEADERTLVLHDLFREALQERLQRRWPAEVPALLKRAALGEPDPVRRIGFLLRAQDWFAAEAALVEVAHDLLLRGGMLELQRLIAQFDAAWREASPRLLSLSGLAHRLRWQWAPMLQDFEGAVQAARKRGDQVVLQEAQAYLAAVLYPLGRHAEAEALIAELSTQPLAPHPRMLLLIGDCLQRLRRAEMATVAPVFAELLDLLAAHGTLFHWWECVPAYSWSTLPGMARELDRYIDGALARLGGRPLAMRGEVHVVRAFTRLWAGRVDEAVEQIAHAEADLKWLASSGDATVGVGLFRAIDAALRGLPELAEQRLQALLVREEGSPEERLVVWRHQMAVYGVRLSHLSGAGPGVLRQWAALLKDTPLGPDRADAPPSPRVLAVRARVAVLEGRWADAAALFAGVVPQLPSMDVMAHAVELGLRAAHALWQAGQRDEAAAALRPVVERLAREPARGQALLAGPEVLSLLAAQRWGDDLPARGLDELREAAVLSQRLREAAPPAPAAGGSATVSRGGDDELLSQREREVLELMAAGDSNKHIARALDISPHTVKRHVANILDKLGLASRGQASAWWRDHRDTTVG